MQSKNRKNRLLIVNDLHDQKTPNLGFSAAC